MNAGRVIDARNLMFPAPPDDVVYFRTLSNRIGKATEIAAYGRDTFTLDPWGVYVTHWVDHTRYARQPVFPD